MGRLNNKVAIVTGAGQGLGAEIVRLFAKEGAYVVGTARRENMVQSVMDNIDGTDISKLLAMHQNVSLREDWEKVVKTAVEKFYGIDILVNNAAQVTETDILHCTQKY